MIEVPISDELDISCWELRKALQLLRKFNPALLEWLDSPIIYWQDEAVMELFRLLEGHYFSKQRGRCHYLSMAKKNFREYPKGETVRYKKYLYVLRPLPAVRWIDAGLGVPPMRFAELVAGTVKDGETVNEINALLLRKMRDMESDYGPRRPWIHALIEEALSSIEQKEVDVANTLIEDEVLDQFLMKTVTGVYR